MAVPSEKSTPMEQLTDLVSMLTFGRRRSASVRLDRCVACNQEATEFDDDLSAREFSISGLCQTCQDAIWPKDDGGDDGYIRFD